MATPRVSILVPNYNNGRESSRSGDRDLIGDLFSSLMETLAHDPTPLEILVADDGSTDDSRQTCREWSKRTWPEGPRKGEPFCRLIELEHSGVLSIVANLLTREARGEYCCRLDGDIIVHTPRWAESICEVLAHGPPRLGVVGPKQLAMDGTVHSAGSWILHPRGHHHLAQGADPRLVRLPREVDHVMGCFYCHRRVVWDDLGGYDERFLRGQTVDFGLRARSAGWSTWFVPTVEFTHCHAERAKRDTDADSDDGIEVSLGWFARKWGFDRLAPDLDEVSARYSGTPLLWNARVFGPAAPWPPPSAGPVDPAHSEWSRYGEDDRFRAAINRRVEIAVHACDVLSSDAPRVVEVGSRGGLLLGLLGRAGCQCTGVESDRHLLQLARMMCSRQGSPATFVHQADRRRLPLPDGSAEIVLLFDQLQRHHNPVGLLNEAHRVLVPGGLIAVLVPERNVLDDHAEGYRAHELVLQVQGTRLFSPDVEYQTGAPDGALTLVARRRGANDSRFHGADVEVKQGTHHRGTEVTEVG
ncbi:MAG: methyltransferase domain-containing protein [Planctomycetota bacterium]|jgi:glycosyltransferase involved in cell wall biosynthesis